MRKRRNKQATFFQLAVAEWRSDRHGTWLLLPLLQAQRCVRLKIGAAAAAHAGAQHSSACAWSRLNRTVKHASRNKLAHTSHTAPSLRDCRRHTRAGDDCTLHRRGSLATPTRPSTRHQHGRHTQQHTTHERHR